MLMLFCKFRIHRGHFCLKLVLHFLRYWLNGFLFPREFNPFRDCWQRVFRAHAESGVISHEPGLLPAVMVSGVIASDDALHLPPSKFVKKLPTRKTYLAHEELIQFVGGG